MELTVFELDELIDKLKVAKNDFVLLFGNLIIGIDSHFSYLKVYHVSGFKNEKLNNLKLCVNFNELVAFRKLLTPNDMLYLNNNTITQYNGSLLFNLSNNLIMNIYYIYVRMLEQPPICRKRYDNLRDNENFENIISMKASDGASSFILDNYCMILFSSMLPVNKSDKVSLEIFDYGSNFISNFKIQKKKDIELYIYIKFIKL